MTKECLYAIERSGKDVKIGRSINPTRRITAIETQAGFRATKKIVSKPLLCAGKAESIIHHHFSRFRTIGEWFEIPFSDVEKAFSDEIWTTPEYQKKLECIKKTNVSEKDLVQVFYDMNEISVKEMVKPREKNDISSAFIKCKQALFFWSHNVLESPYDMPDYDDPDDITDPFEKMICELFASEYEILEDRIWDMVDRGISPNQAADIICEEYNLKTNPITFLNITPQSSPVSSG